jgi:hypothetical protein
VVAAEHERDEPGAPPRGNLVTRCVELLARRGPVRELAVADVGQREVFEIPLGPWRVGLDRIGGQTEVARAAVGALAQVDPALERDAVDDDATVGKRPVAGDEPR